MTDKNATTDTTVVRLAGSRASAEQPGGPSEGGREEERGIVMGEGGGEGERCQDEQR